MTYGDYRDVLLANPDLFILHYFPHRIQKLEEFHQRLIVNATTRDRGLILYPAAHGKCCLPQTPVLMGDGTLLPAGEIKDGDVLSTGVCVESQSNGVGPTVRVLLRTGHEMTCTPDHPFAVRDQRFPERTSWVNACDLVKGDEVALLDGFEAPGSDLSLEAFRLLGYIAGDGSVSHGNCMVTTVDYLVERDVIVCAGSLGFGWRKAKGSGNCFDIHLKGGARKWLRDHGLYGKGSYEKRVPAEVFKGSSEQIRHFLAAYHACDGSFSRGTSGFEYYSVSEHLLRDVQHLLLRLGIVSSLSRKNGKYLEQNHQSWRLRIPAGYYDEVRRWPILLDRKLPPRTEDITRYLTRVISVEETGERETWALQIDTGVHYTADMLTHNTTLVSTMLPIWAFCKDPNVRIAIVGKNDSEAGGIMRVIQAECVTNKPLIQDFGPFKPDPGDRDKPWALGEMSVYKRTKLAKEPTIAVFGSGAKTTLGHRTDWTICDDVVTNENAATPSTREKLRAWFNMNIETGPESVESRLTVVGTLFDPEDLYHDIMDMTNPEDGTPIYFVQREDAITDEEDRVTLWPERWPWRRLMIQKAKLGTLDFNRRYRNIAVDASRMVFREEYIKGGWIGHTKYPGCVDRTYRVGDVDPSWLVYSGFDPAVGTGRSSKFCAHIALAVGSCKDHERCYWVVDLERDQMTQPQMVDLILKKHQDYHMFMSVIEANAFQAGLWQSVQQKMNEQGLAFKIEPHYTTRVNKPNTEAGVQSMSPWFENGKVHIPWGDPVSQGKMKVFVDELIMYPGRTTDTVMAFWFAWLKAEHQAPKYQSFNRLEKRMVWETRGRPTRFWQNPYYDREASGAA